ncbi:MAG: hypothetical protein QM652_04285, partial [Legionella sp.]|uniref:hypothetical protein n=1 Tax=Legionella sp. TaxID=459 RepID=UPI0039E6F458
MYFKTSQHNPYPKLIEKNRKDKFRLSFTVFAMIPLFITPHIVSADGGAGGGPGGGSGGSGYMGTAGGNGTGFGGGGGAGGGAGGTGGSSGGQGGQGGTASQLNGG